MIHVLLSDRRRGTTLRTMLKTALLTFLLAGCAGTWSDHAITTSYVISSSLVACDAGQTILASDHGRWDRVAPDESYYVETNPVLGRTPSPDTLAAIAAANALLGLVVLESSLPKWVKGVWFGGLIAVESVTIAGNTSDGLGACGVAGQVDTVRTTRTARNR